MGNFRRDFTDVAGAFEEPTSRRRRRRIDPRVCERCLRFVDSVEDALDDFYFDDRHDHKCCKCCPRRGGYWGRDDF